MGVPADLVVKGWDGRPCLKSWGGSVGRVHGFDLRCERLMAGFQVCDEQYGRMDMVEVDSMNGKSHSQFT